MIERRKSLKKKRRKRSNGWQETRLTSTSWSSQDTLNSKSSRPLRTGTTWLKPRKLKMSSSLILSWPNSKRSTKRRTRPGKNWFSSWSKIQFQRAKRSGSSEWVSRKLPTSPKTSTTSLLSNESPSKKPSKGFSKKTRKSFRSAKSSQFWSSSRSRSKTTMTESFWPGTALKTLVKGILWKTWRRRKPFQS